METDKELEDEIADVLKIYDKHEALVDQLGNLILAVTAWIMGGRIQDNVSDLLKATTLDTPPLEAAYNTTTQNFLYAQPLQQILRT